jgi:membrane-bound lytic murein transglycosylase B
MCCMALIGCMSPLAFAAAPPRAIGHTQAPSQTAPSFAERSIVRAFVASMHQKHGIDQKKLLALLAQCRTNQKVLSLMDKQFEAKPWYEYRARVLSATRIQEGALFWKTHAKTLKKIQTIYGVPPEIIVSIIGLETSYGQIMGSFNVLETLSTLAFDYPRRAAFFKKELEALLLLAQEGAVDLATAKGSYAGAMGMPQFMPSNYRAYAVDFSGKGQRDLLHNTEDVLGSVAYYLRKHGWQSGKSIVRPLRKFEKSPRPPSLKLWRGDPLLEKGAKPLAFNKKNKIRTIVLKDSPKTEKYYAGLPNFSVIMRYNNSTHYAMAIVVLSEQIRKTYQHSKGAL